MKDTLYNELRKKNLKRSNKKDLKKQVSIIKDRSVKISLNQDDIELIKSKANLLAKDIANKYRINEEQVYDELYLKVRKMFVELL